MRNLIIMAIALLLIGVAYSATIIYVQDQDSGVKTDQFDYAASAIDTSEAISIGDYSRVWVDYYVKLQSSTTFTLGLDVMAQYTSGGDYIIFHDGGAVQSAITSSAHGRMMLRNGDSCAIPQGVNFKLRSQGTVTGDSATVWYVIGGY